MSAGAQAPGAGKGRQIALITAAAAALFIVVRNLPTGTNLSHMDFRVEGGNVIQFCDPGNPQFLPVVDVRSPVSLVATPLGPPAAAGADVDATLTLTTFSGKQIGPEDLRIVQTRPIHLLIVDPSLDDYQHVHPVPGPAPGQWTFRFHPRFGGTYRIFADFTPVATNRGLYASTDLVVEGTPNPVKPGSQPLSWSADRDGFRFVLSAAPQPIRVGQPTDLKLAVTRLGGGGVPLEPVMDAYAHLVAFDTGRSGFAHIHPNPQDAGLAPDPVRPEFAFRLGIPKAGRYVIWCQVNLAGKERYVPLWVDVQP